MGKYIGIYPSPLLNVLANHAHVQTVGTRPLIFAGCGRGLGTGLEPSVHSKRKIDCRLGTEEDFSK